MKIGDVLWANLGEIGEKGDCVQCGIRPVVIFSNDKCCSFSPVVNVVPITSSTTKKKMPTHVEIKGLKKTPSFVLPEQIQTVSKKCILGEAIYRLSESELAMVKAAVKLQLGIN